MAYVPFADEEPEKRCVGVAGNFLSDGYLRPDDRNRSRIAYRHVPLYEACSWNDSCIGSKRRDLSDDGEIHHDEEVLSLPKGVEVYEIDGPFFFGVASKFDDIMHNMGDKPKIRIIRMRKVPFMDSTGLHNLENLFRLSQAEHIHMILSGVNEHVRRVLVKSGFDKKIGTENICSNINEAVAKAHEAIR